MPDAFKLWQEGDLTDVQALRTLCSDYGENASELELLKAHEQELRDQLSIIIDKIGKTEIPGFGTLEITSPSVTKGYSKDKIDALVMKLIEDGYGPVAQQILQCRTETQRAGSLRIVREKQR